jgi:hypothetical protein
LGRALGTSTPDTGERGRPRDRTENGNEVTTNRLSNATDQNNPALGSLGVGWTYDQVSNVTGLEIGTLVPLALTYDARDLVASLSGEVAG